MASTGVVRVTADVETTRQQFRAGYHTLNVAVGSQQAQWLPLSIADSTTVEVIGGTSPIVSAITSCTTFCLFDNDQALLVAFEGANASTQALTVTTSNQGLIQTGVTITQLTIRNESGSTATCLILVDGS